MEERYNYYKAKQRKRMDRTMGLNDDCKACLYRRQLERMEGQENLNKKEEYLNKVKILIDEADGEDAAPVVMERISRLHKVYFKTSFSFDVLKKNYNQVMLEREASIRKKIEEANDPLKASILYARVGNYIDFGALGSVDDEKLNILLDGALQEELSDVDYEEFKKDIKNAKIIVLLTDNCGEIVLDKLLIEQIKKQNQACRIVVIVRGEPILNDATMEDAIMVGLTELAEVYGNGTGIAGTSLRHINKTARDVIESADLIISKGQGNFETMNHCGLNVFYLFLCKCSWFVRRFDMKQYQGVFVQDKNLK